MRTHPTHPPALDLAAESAVVLALLSRTTARTRAQLQTALLPIASSRVDQALDSLARAGLLAVKGQKIIATDALRRLDALGFISV